MKAKERETGDLNRFRISWAGGEEPSAVANLRTKDNTTRSTPPLPSTSTSTSTSASSTSAFPKPAFNTPAFAPAFSMPAFGGGARTFGSFPSTVSGLAYVGYCVARNCCTDSVYNAFRLDYRFLHLARLPRLTCRVKYRWWTTMKQRRWRG